MAGRTKSWLSCFKQRRDKEISPNLLRNGGALLEKLIAIFGGRYQNPIHYFTAEQLTTATNHFADILHKDSYQDIFRGSLDGLSILVTRHSPILRQNHLSITALDSGITNLAVSSQLSQLKNVLKFIGCCLEFESPVLVYEAAGAQVLANLFTSSNNYIFLPWKNRVRIAKDIASTLTYLHTAFPGPIILRDFQLRNVMIDQCGNAKLFNFSLSILLPPGRKKVELNLIQGTHGYLAPEYAVLGQVTEKVDVYSFGILLFELLVGRVLPSSNFDPYYTLDEIVDHYTLDQIVDFRIWETEKETEFRGFLDLALRCTKENEEERPDMIDVAKELCRIEKN